MSTDDINNRPKPADPHQDPQVAPSQGQQVDDELKITFESVRSELEDMLQFNFSIVHSLLGQISAINPFRPDMALGKQPGIAATEASDASKSSSVTPVGEASAEAFVARLQHVQGMMGAQDIKLQAMYDKLALSRSGHKPDLASQGREFEQLKGIVNQAETRMYQALSRLPETLPEASGQSVTRLMPEFVDALNSFDDSFRHALEAVQQHILEAKSP